MQVHKTVIKRARQTVKLTLKNQALKKKMKKAIKAIKTAETKDAATKLYPGTIRMLHRLAQKRIIARNKANRYQSRLATYINGIA